MQTIASAALLAALLAALARGRLLASQLRRLLAGAPDGFVVNAAAHFAGWVRAVWGRLQPVDERLELRGGLSRMSKLEIYGPC